MVDIGNQIYKKICKIEERAYREKMISKCSEKGNKFTGETSKELMQYLYKRNLKLLTSQLPTQSKQQNDRILKAQSDLGYIFMHPLIMTDEPIVFENCQREELVVYPHGRYASYISLAEACQFQDELTQIFPYFAQFEENNMSHCRLLRYSVFSSALLKIAETNHMEKQKRSLQFQRCWQRFIRKYMCDLDLTKRMEIYLEVLKEGTSALSRYYKSYEQSKEICEFDVFVKAIMSCENHFEFRKREKYSYFNNNNSYQQPAQKSDETCMETTFKMLFCSICNIYDCGRHEDDLIDIRFGHHYAAPNNLFTQQQLISSAINLLRNYKILLNTDIEIKQQHCSARCYYNLSHIKNHKYLQQLRKGACSSSIFCGLVKMGIQMFKFDPCLIWSLIHSEGQQIIVTCDMLFLYLIEDYGIANILNKKLCDSEVEYLKKESRLPNNLNNPHQISEIDHQICDIRKISVCHHYFIGEDPIDTQCNDCICTKRGYCLKQCLCTDNCLLKRGCDCKNPSECYNSKCYCYKRSRECQPGICKNCFCENYLRRNKCKNNAIQKKQLILLRVGVSTIKNCGLGLFAGENIVKKQFVCTYSGQIVESEIEDIRQSINQVRDFYNFGKDDESAVDSRFMGNKSRFINHGDSGSDNLVSEIKFVNGTEVIAFYARRNIAKDQELFFDYDGSGQLFSLHSNKYPFIQGIQEEK